MEICNLKTVHEGINLTENFKITCFQVNMPAGALPEARKFLITRTVFKVLK